MSGEDQPSTQQGQDISIPLEATQSVKECFVALILLLSGACSRVGISMPGCTDS